MMNNRQGGDALINFMAARFQSGGMVAPMKKAASALEKQGRKGDTELVHVTPGELSLLEQIGAGTTNPVTGLREFYAAEGVDAGDVGTDSGAGSASPGAANASGDDGPGGDSDPSGMAGFAADAAKAVAARGGTTEDQVSAAMDAISAMDDAMQGAGSGADVAADVARLAKDQLGISRPFSLSDAVTRALDLDDDGKISPKEMGVAALKAFTPVGPVMALGEGLAGLARGLGLPDPDPSVMDDSDQFGDGGDNDSEVAAAPEIQEALTIEELTKPPTIDIVPFRPQDFYYFTQQQRQGLPSMMNMRNR